MSSHHFVREDQEPALLILDADALSFSKIQELLEWSPTVVVSHAALETVLGWGIKIDGVVAYEHDKVNLMHQLSDQGPLRWIWIQPYDRAAEMVFHFFLASRQRYLNVVGNISPDIQELVQAWSDRLQVTWFDQQQRWSWITSGKLDKWFPKGATYSCQEEDTITHYVVEEDQLIQLNKHKPFWFIEPA